MIKPDICPVCHGTGCVPIDPIFIPNYCSTTVHTKFVIPCKHCGGKGITRDNNIETENKLYIGVMTDGRNSYQIS